MQELSQIPELNQGGVELIRLALAQFPNLVLEATPNGRWVTRPANFVTFKIHHKRARNITLTLRGTTDQFPENDELAVRPDRGSYSALRITHSNQFSAAGECLRRAAEIYRTSSRRAQ